MFIQNKESKCFLTQENDHPKHSEHPNVSAERQPTVRSAWNFLYASHGAGSPGPNKIFHIVSAVFGGVLDHWDGRVIHASLRVQDNIHTWWEIIPYGGASVIIKSRASGRLLCHAGASTGDKMVQTAEGTEYQNEKCQWHVTDDPREGSQSPDISLVYDTHLSLTNPIMALRANGKRTPLLDGPGEVGTVDAYLGQAAVSTSRQNEVTDAAQKERDLVTRVAGRGYTAFVISPEGADVGNEEVWERVRLFRVNDEMVKVYRGPRCS